LRGWWQVIQRKHDSIQKANMFQKRLVWDCMYKEEFIKVRHTPKSLVYQSHLFIKVTR